MARRDSRVVAVLETIESANLSANDRWMLARFVSGSLAPVEAAEYICGQILKHSRVEDALLAIKTDLISLGLKLNCDVKVPEDLDAAVRERENNRCFLTGAADGLQPTYIVAPSILDDDGLRSGGHLRPLLEASISTEVLEQLEGFLRSQNKTDKLKNLLLLTTSIRDAFCHGEIRINRPLVYYPKVDFHLEETDPWFGKPKPTDLRWKAEMTPPALRWLDMPGDFKPSTPDGDALPLPKRSLLYVQKVVSLPLQFLAVEQVIWKGWPPVKQEFHTPGSFMIGALRLISRCIPRFVRLAFYRYIHRTLPSVIPTVCGSSAARLLPFGLCLKESGHATTRNEATALQLVEEYTKDIPAPKSIDHVTVEDGTGFILMTRIPGDQLDLVLFRMTNEERKALGRDLWACIKQLRRVPNTASKDLITNTYGGPAYDYRFDDRKCGPFNSTTDLANYLAGRSTEEETRAVYPELAPLYEKKHEVYLTHSDLHQSNIFVQAGKLAGIVDWEYAGFKPEYWEYTKSLWAYCARGSQKTILDEAFKDEDYHKELEAEMCLWEHRPVF